MLRLSFVLILLGSKSKQSMLGKLIAINACAICLFSRVMNPQGSKGKLSRLGKLIAINASVICAFSHVMNLQGSKGKLSKLGKLIAIKAPKSSPKRSDSRFGDDIVPSKYYHVNEDRWG